MPIYSNVLKTAFVESIKTFGCATELRGLWAFAAQPELLLLQTSILCGPARGCDTELVEADYSDSQWLFHALRG